MKPSLTRPVVHLELHTGDLREACSFYEQLCGWRSAQIETPVGSYTALGLGPGIDGGVVESPTGHALWLPYVEVERIAQATDHARVLGARVVIEPREGPAGWRSVIATPAAGEVALWQRKR